MIPPKGIIRSIGGWVPSRPGDADMSLEWGGPRGESAVVASARSGITSPQRGAENNPCWDGLFRALSDECSRATSPYRAKTDNIVAPTALYRRGTARASNIPNSCLSHGHRRRAADTDLHKDQCRITDDDRLSLLIGLVLSDTGSTRKRLWMARERYSVPIVA